MVGVGHYQGFLIDFVPRPLLFTSTTELWLGGLWYSVPLLLILGAHEMGHYLACRLYGIDATMPFFIPVPIGMIGTFGAFIRIRGRINTRPVLFDMAAAGPIAGFVIAVPAMFTGLMMSRVVRLPADFTGFELGEPLLFKAASYMVFGSIADGWALNLHPMAMAAWFGMLVTALNLLPVVQLDGGHIAYAVFGRKSSYISVATVASLALLLAFVSYSWLPWVVLLLAMMKLFGLHHPPTYDEHVALDRGRLAVAVLTVLILASCFTPAPIEVYELIRPR
jgi:membrane-associated protease RseP (regulator of RpoE activity)